MQKTINRVFFPSFGGYKRRSLAQDFIAALVVTAIAIPESLGFAAIVGLPLQTGLYTALLAPIVFAIFTASRHLVVGADSATAALVASGAATLAAAHSPQYAGAVALLGVMTGVMLLLMSVFRFGFLADLISRPVLVGFLAGVGVQLVVGRLPEMLGVEVAGGLLNGTLELLHNLDIIHWPTLLVAAVTLSIVLVLGRYKLPGALVGLVVAIVVTKLCNLPQYGVHVVGDIPVGLPQLAWPDFTVGQLSLLFTSAFAIAVVILAQSSAVIRSFASKYDEPVRDNKDLMALGLANIASSLTQGFAVNGSPPRSSAGEMAGGRSQMVNIFMALLIGAVLLFATDVLTIVPQAALAAIVCAIGIHLINIGQLRDIWRAHRVEFLIAIIALLAVALLGVQQGVMIAVVASLIERLRREYRPADDILLRDGEVNPWAATRIEGSHKYSSRPDGVLVYHFDSDLFFENSTYFAQRLQQAIDDAHEPVHSVILDAGAMGDIDYTGATALKKIVAQLAADDIRFSIAHVSPGFTRLLDDYHLTDAIGKEHIYSSLRAAIHAQPNSRRSVVEMVRRLKLPSHGCVVIGGGVLEALGIRDTLDVDLVVSKKTYREFRAQGWHEEAHDDGKHVLVHRGYRVMTSFMGLNLSRLQKQSFELDDVQFMGLDDLIRCKELLGRAKDRKDVRLIAAYRRKKRVGGVLAKHATDARK